MLGPGAFLGAAYEQENTSMIGMFPETEECPGPIFIRMETIYS